MKNPDLFKLIKLPGDKKPELDIGAIYLLQDISYDICTRMYNVVVEKIGEPVPEGNQMINIEYR